MGFKIAIGDLKKCEEFILRELSANKVSRYNIITYDDKVGVVEARAIIKLLSLKNSKNDSKAIVVTGKMTLEAQNALLKSLEELHENWLVIFASEKKENFLPTILSRGFTQVFISGENLDTGNFVQLLDNEQSVWHIAESLPEDKNLSMTLDEIQAALRNDLLKAVKNNDLSSVAIRMQRIKKLLKLTPLTLNNNVQMRLILEKAFFA